MFDIRITMTAAVTAFALTTTGAFALTPLPKEAHINHSLMSGVAADYIRKSCPSISARMITAWGKLNGLKTYAENKGYQEAEVRAFLKNPTEKARVKAMAAAYLKSQGVIKGNAESYCVVGRQEIAKKSLIGQMLRAK